MFRKSRLLIKYIHYWLTSVRKISDGQYQFVNDLLAGSFNEKNPVCHDKIKLFSRELTATKTLLNIIDFGAGSLTDNSNIRQAGKFIRASSISHRYGRFLSCLVNYVDPAVIIELGTGAGISSIYMANASPDCSIYSIEGSPEVADFANRNLISARIKNVKIINGSFRNKLPEILLQVHHPLLVFIDGDHRGEHLIEYYQTILPFTSGNSVIILDDIKWSESMEKAWEYIIRQKEVSVSLDLFRMGVLFLNKNIDKHHFRVRF